MAFSSSVVTSKKWSNGRHGRPNPNDVRGVIIHHMAGYFDGGVAQGVKGPYTAHFYIGNNQCVELIPAEQSGWHAANSYYNNYFVGIEHANTSLSPNWLVAESTLVTSAKLMADLSRYYKWGKLVYGKNVFTHTGVSQSGTACPGPHMLKNLNRLIDMANKELENKGSVSSGVKKDGSNLPINNNIKVGQFQSRVNVTLNIRKSNSTNSPIVGSLKPGDIITVNKQVGAWGQIDGYKDNPWVYLHNNYTTPINRGPSPKGNFKPYTVKITAQALNVRKEPNTGSEVVTLVKNPQIYTIVEEKNGWGKLKSGIGWVSLKYTTKF